MWGLCIEIETEPSYTYSCWSLPAFGCIHMLPRQLQRQIPFSLPILAPHPSVSGQHFTTHFALLWGRRFSFSFWVTSRKPTLLIHCGGDGSTFCSIIIISQVSSEHPPSCQMQHYGGTIQWDLGGWLDKLGHFRQILAGKDSIFSLLGCCCSFLHLLFWWGYETAIKSYMTASEDKQHCFLLVWVVCLSPCWLMQFCFSNRKMGRNVDSERQMVRPMRS